MPRARVLLAWVLCALVFAPASGASELFADFNVRNVTLKVNRKGEALVTYTTTSGKGRPVLVWGAINAVSPPSETIPQVRFKYDYAGGWGKYRKLVYKAFVNKCKKYDGPPLPYFVAGCKASDGSYWALQRWQRRLPLLGFDPWLPIQTVWELHISHWNTELPAFEVSTNWTYGFQWQGVFGRLSYLGHPVYGFRSTSEGNPRERYGRNVYIDTFNSAYGPGWKRESGILTHRNTGTFCHSFVPQKPFAGYPSQDIRPAAPGERYRATVMGPGVTPVLMWEDVGLPMYNAPNPDHVWKEEQANAVFDRIMAGDRTCAQER